MFVFGGTVTGILAGFGLFSFIHANFIQPNRPSTMQGTNFNADHNEATKRIQTEKGLNPWRATARRTSRPRRTAKDCKRRMSARHMALQSCSTWVLQLVRSAGALTGALFGNTFAREKDGIPCRRETGAFARGLPAVACLFKRIST